MKRYAVVQKARDADVFGILVGTLGVGLSTPSRCPYRFADLTFSILPSTDFADTEAFGSGSEKELHHQCRETQSNKTCELS
jgi:hypothetical protein